MSLLPTSIGLCRPPHVCFWKWNKINKGTWNFLKQTTIVDKRLAEIFPDIWDNSNEEEFFIPSCSPPGPTPPPGRHTVN